MPASLRDVRVVSPAVNLPGPQFTAVLDATREALTSAGLGAGDIGLFKVNEAFGALPLIAQGEFGIPDGNLNVNGAPPPSSTRSARPARMLTDLSHELERSPSRYGLQAICGTASTAVIERQ